jgi:hypothetical protein
MRAFAEQLGIRTADEIMAAGRLGGLTGFGTSMWC